MNDRGLLECIDEISDILFRPGNGRIDARIVRPLDIDENGSKAVDSDGVNIEDLNGFLEGVLYLYRYDPQNGPEFIQEIIVDDNKWKSFIGLSDSDLYYITVDGFSDIISEMILFRHIR